LTDSLKQNFERKQFHNSQAAALPETDRESVEVEERLRTIKSRYKELLDFAKDRRQKLLNARCGLASV